MNMLTRLSNAFGDVEDLDANGAALVGLFGRDAKGGVRAGFVPADRRTRRRARARRT
ncbi:MAG: hypothetical protein AAGF15_00530 [Pseudomonadota bacterium]